jgi:signal peptidase I
MEPTIMAGDEILIARCAYWFHEPSRGDLIVFGTKSIPKIPQDKSGKEIMYTKRLVGLPGDRVEIREGSVWINNTKMEFGDPNHPIEYRSGPLQYAFWLREREYFALGDNSRNSFDSRYWGALPRQAIYGKVTKIYWPWNRISTPR